MKSDESLRIRLESLLERALESREKAIHVYGSTSPALLALLLSQQHNNLLGSFTHLVVVANADTAVDFQTALEFYNADSVSFCLDGYDISPYSGLFPNAKSIAQRVGWLSLASRSIPGQIFIAPNEALAQKTMPIDVLRGFSRAYKKGSVVTQVDFQFFKFVGYQEVPRVDDVGQFSVRGGIVDIFPPTSSFPIRIELFGDTIETLRAFNPESQRSQEEVSSFEVCPAREVLFFDERRQLAVQRFNSTTHERPIEKRELEVVQQDLSLGRYFPGVEFLLPYFYETLNLPIQFFSGPLIVWELDSLKIQQSTDLLFSSLKAEFDSSQELLLRVPYEELYSFDGSALKSTAAKHVLFSQLEISEAGESAVGPNHIHYSSSSNIEFRNSVRARAGGGEDYIKEAVSRISFLKNNHYSVFISTHTRSQAQRLSFLLEQGGLSVVIVNELESDWSALLLLQKDTANLIHIIPRPLSDSLRIGEDHLVFLTEDDFFSKKEIRKDVRAQAAAPTSAKATDLDFGDLSPGDYVVHIQHGVGYFDGLKVMSVNGIEAEFLQLSYKDKDRLYLPVYRISQIQKFSGVPTLDKLGGTNWQKTKIKVRSHLRDLASELLSLYAKRSQIKRPPLGEIDDDYRRFESLFPYDETDDQLRAIDAVLNDFEKDHPMDRLICGDVGFGKTEVAMRAAFRVAQAGQQVALLVPTTVLAFQHLETFRARFKGLPLSIYGLSRFTPKNSQKEILEGLKKGSVDIVIGTHRLLSKDVEFKNLGLLIVDEEQKFGVAHKEKIKKIKSNVDTLALSATPIPRTLNLSLVGIRDLSLINTAPRDRLPIRTFVCKFEPETIRKAILSEVQRGGQVYYVHNRVQSIYSLADELRALVPEVKIRVAHGQMEEGALEETMVAFFKHEFDVLLCTTIIESGVDIARANTMIVDRADTFGLSQLYQLRGRIGRAKDRAYCYLLIPKQGIADSEAQERLKVLQENSSLGSGFRIAHHDLELRGAGNILGEEQSGHINAVGYELYLELLEDALKTARGESLDDKELEPELNLKIPALIPDAYIPDIRIRLQFYKTLSNIKGIDDLDEIESDLKDQFGPPPPEVLNLLGVMLIRRMCKDLGVRDISSGLKSVSLAFTEKTKMSPKVIIDLALREKKRYTLTPDSRLIIKQEQQGWPEIYEELVKLKKLAGLL